MHGGKIWENFSYHVHVDDAETICDNCVSIEISVVLEGYASNDIDGLFRFQ